MQSDQHRVATRRQVIGYPLDEPVDLVPVIERERGEVGDRKRVHVLILLNDTGAHLEEGGRRFKSDAAADQASDLSPSETSATGLVPLIGAEPRLLASMKASVS